jgi:hypothetical protein
MRAVEHLLADERARTLLVPQLLQVVEQAQTAGAEASADPQEDQT